MIGNPKLSIVIPTFQSANTLYSCLHSLAQQTYRDFEVRIMDGVSKDDTLSIASSFSEQLPALIVRSEPDKGIYDAMNKGITEAKGEWIFFLGSDDALYAPETLEQISSHLHPAVHRMVYGNVRIKGNNEWLKEGDVHDGLFDEIKLTTQNICHQAIFYHKSLFEQYGLYEVKYKMLADWNFNLQVFQKANPLYVETIVSHYHVEGSSYHASSSDLFHFEKPILVHSLYSIPLLSGYYKAQPMEIHILAEHFKKEKLWSKYVLSVLRIQLNRLLKLL